MIQPAQTQRALIMDSMLFANYQLDSSQVEPMAPIFDAASIPSESIILSHVKLQEFPEILTNGLYGDFFLFCQQFGQVKTISDIQLDSVSTFTAKVAYSDSEDASKLLTFVKLLNNEVAANYDSASSQLQAPSNTILGNCNFDFSTYNLDHPFIKNLEKKFKYQKEPTIAIQNYDEVVELERLNRLRRDSVISASSNESISGAKLGQVPRNTLSPAKSIGIIDTEALKEIAEGRDTRTTVMIRNIPNKYTPSMLQDFLDSKVRGLYDFLYLRMDFKNKCNVGYAFINFIEARSISLLKDFVGIKMPRFKSEKKLAISFASIQGLDKLISKFQNSTVMLQEDKDWRPKLYHAEGPQKGKEKAFPKPLGGNYRPKSSILYSRQ